MVKERASEIFQNVFSEMFLANCGNPVEYDMVKSEIESMMKIKFDEATTWSFDQCFYAADTSKVSQVYANAILE